LEKPVNNSVVNMTVFRKTFAGILVFLLGLFTPLHAQVENFVKGRNYILDSIIVSGLKTFNDQTLISYSGLRKGQNIALPGE